MFETRSSEGLRPTPQQPKSCGVWRALLVSGVFWNVASTVGAWRRVKCDQHRSCFLICPPPRLGVQVNASWNAFQGPIADNPLFLRPTLWFVSIACAQYVGGLVAQVASVETVGGQVTNLKVSLDTYAGVFETIGFASAAIGGVLLLISPLLKRLMHGVK